MSAAVMHQAAQEHPWQVLRALVTDEIISKDDARSIVMANQNMHRAALLEIGMALQDARADGVGAVAVADIEAILHRRQVLDLP